MARLLGTTPKTLRHYESLRLLPKPARSAAGYRIYDSGALARATLVIGMRRMGLDIGEICDVVAGDAGDAELRRRLARLFDEKIRDADEQLGILAGRREDLAARQRRLVLGTPGECLCRLLSMPCTCKGGRPV
jgi:DNA-binding transcriptional MerR regulator